MGLDVLDLTRLQFAVVTIYHYLFVPLSISLSAATAGLQIAWMRTGDDRYRKLTLLVGKLLIVTFAVGVVTGLVQEFQFGLAWSEFARFYGDVFGPTLAVEGMLAFFLEATFLALWYFGWDRLPRGVHLATIVVVAVGTLLSAFIILAANSFMQHPVAYELDPVTGRAHLTSFRELLLNEVNLAAFPHTIAGAVMVGGALLLAVGAWRAWPRRTAPDDEQRHRDAPAFATLGRLGAWMTLAGGALTALTGDHLGKVITRVQPMKMAAAEALYSTTTGAPFSVFAVGRPGGGEPFLSIEIPRLLSVLATGDPNATVAGIDDLQAQYTAAYGPGSYIPMVPVAFWSFRAMIGVGMLAMLFALVYLWRTRRGRTPAPWLVRCAVLVPLLPAAANTFGWLFTETARQPWIAFGLSKVADGISPGLTSGEVLVSLLAFTAVYGILAVVWLRLVRHLASRPLSGPPDPGGSDRTDPADPTGPAADADLALTY
ncbi:cytochrome ubiquinol oxidase subunit I [Dactylosporangium roseum]|uniref:Cytochrome ubiquinol oxidase subunit I n=1 Tax=Dactylosporangium roseum TaxID=47989 RepID=A0ABY5YZ05_9ACTN|nr:cytochrome ubiquinol oxidase subunit I [Dactylosporangium roseum]UWZ33464.1 cytochrome ubiquinol oxidase subunit I [Dactylosporangium roseum]